MNALYTEVGQPIGYYRGYIVDGIYQTNAAIDKTLQPNAVLPQEAWNNNKTLVQNPGYTPF